MNKRNIRLITLLLTTGSLVAAGSSYAEGTGFYVGASAGYSSINTPSGNVFVSQSNNNNLLNVETSSSSTGGGFGGNLFAGYNINKNIAVELGYTSYAQSQYNAAYAQYKNIGTDEWVYTDHTNSSSISYNTYSIDAFLKGSMPILAQLSAFAKIGLSYVSQSVDYQNPTGTPTIDVNNGALATPGSGTNTYTAVRPAGALGFTYQINEHFSSSLFAQGFLGDGDLETDKSAIATAYLLGASLTYAF